MKKLILVAVSAALACSGPVWAQTAAPPAPPAAAPASPAQLNLEKIFSEYGTWADNAALQGTEPLRFKGRMQAAFADWMKELQAKVSEAAKADEAKLTAKDSALTVMTQRATAAEGKVSDLQRQLALPHASSPAPVAPKPNMTNGGIAPMGHGKKP